MFLETSNIREPRPDRLQRFGNILLLAVLLIATGAAAQTSDSPLVADLDDDRASRWVESRRWGAILLWAGLIVSSVIIGIVRTRQRREQKRRQAAENPPA